MEAEHWISVGSLIVAGLAIIAGPYVAGRVAKAQDIAERRIDIYAEAINLMRLRLFEVEDLSTLGAHPYAGPTDEEGDAMAGRMLLVSNGPTWRVFARFFALYQSTNLARALVDQARKGGGPAPAAQAQLAQAAQAMRPLLDQAIDRMASDVGTRRTPLAAQPAQAVQPTSGASRLDRLRHWLIRPYHPRT